MSRAPNTDVATGRQPTKEFVRVAPLGWGTLKRRSYHSFVFSLALPGTMKFVEIIHSFMSSLACGTMKFVKIKLVHKKVNEKIMHFKNSIVSYSFFFDVIVSYSYISIKDLKCFWSREQNVWALSREQNIFNLR